MFPGSKDFERSIICLICSVTSSTALSDRPKRTGCQIMHKLPVLVIIIISHQILPLKISLVLNLTLIFSVDDFNRSFFVLKWLNCSGVCICLPSWVYLLWESSGLYNDQLPKKKTKNKKTIKIMNVLTQFPLESLKVCIVARKICKIKMYKVLMQWKRCSLLQQIGWTLDTT